MVVGLARSGLASANLLYDLGAQVFVTDNQDSEIIRLNAKKLKSDKIKIELGRHTEDFVLGKDLVVISPGITEDVLPIGLARKYKIPVISEIEVAGIVCPGTIIAVTGSSGKTTVTTLIGKILEAKGEKVVVCGNIGNPFCGEVSRVNSGDFVSLEVSSFQLETIRDFRPKIAVLLNVTPNHLDRYNNMEEYIAAKKRIFMNQNETDYLVLNYNDKTVRAMVAEANSKVTYFSEQEGLNQNQAAVLTVGSILGVDKELCLKVFADFKGIEHRLEQVTEINNILFINDSKSTTADSARWAIKNITRPIVMIAGGKDKGVDYSSIIDLARNKVREIILIGQAKDKIRMALGGSLPTEEAKSLEEAVNMAFNKARSGDCVLFSPMCSSFDMFSDYEERGRVFKRVVLALAKNTPSLRNQ